MTFNRAFNPLSKVDGALFPYDLHKDITGRTGYVLEG